nr:uncharacterized protein LOC124812317 isoform X2 [Hydra vulgaris]
MLQGALLNILLFLGRVRQTFFVVFLFRNIYKQKLYLERRKSNMHRLQLYLPLVQELFLMHTNLSLIAILIFIIYFLPLVLSTCATPGWWVKYDHLNEKMYTSAVCNLGVITSQPHL